MTREETKQMLMVLQAAYPNYRPQDKTIAINTWYDALCSHPAQKINAAVKAYILSDTSGFAPSIGQVIDKMRLFDDADEINEMAAWQMVLKAMRNATYHPEEEFARLPAIVQKAVVSPGQLREWATAEDTDGAWMTVTQSNFMRTYRAEVAKEREMRKLSPDLLRLVSKTTEKVAVDQIKPKGISVGEERRAEEEKPVPMPERVREKYEKLKRMSA